MAALIIPTTGSGLLVVVSGEGGGSTTIPSGAPGIQGPPGPPGSGSTIAIKDEGVVQGSPVTAINFTGSAVAATVAGTEATVAISGGSGGGGDTVADRTALAAITTPATGDSAYLAESGREGEFRFDGSNLSAMVTLDTLQGVYVAPAGAPTGASGAWVRVDDRLDPFMFGAVTNYQTGVRALATYGESSTPGSTNGILVDSRAACQKMLDIVAAHENRRFIADFSGGIWGLTANGNGNGLEILARGEKPRTFIGGEFRGIGSGVNLIYARDVGASQFDGFWHLRSGADLGNGFGWNARQWENGFHLRNIGQSSWNFVRGSGFLRWAVYFDPTYYDPGTFPLTDYNNNISCRFKQIYGDYSGSRAAVDGYRFQINYTSGGNTGSSGGFNQRTNLTLAATGTGSKPNSILRVGDIIKSAAGSYHRIEEKVGDVISVFPWMISPPATGTITSCHGGALSMGGKDTAGSGADLLTGIAVGTCLDLSNNLHGTAFGGVIHEAAEIGLLCGTPNGIGGLGHKIGHAHSEAVTRDVLSVGAQNVGVMIGAVSAWAGQDYADAFKLCETLYPNSGSAIETTIGLPWLTIFIGGEWITSGESYLLAAVGTKSRAYTVGMSNNPAHSLIQKVADDLAVSLKYYESVDRCCRNNFSARIELIGTAGGAPTGAVTVTLNAADVTAGVQFLNGTTTSTYVIAAGAATGPVVLEFWLDTNTGGTQRWIVMEKSGVASAVTTQTGTAYTADLTDADDYIRFTNAAAVSFTIPPNSAEPFPLGTVIEMEQAGAGALSVVPGSGVTINSRGADLTLAGQYSVAALKKVATDTWTLVGDL